MRCNKLEGTRGPNLRGLSATETILYKILHTKMICIYQSAYVKIYL